VKCSACVFERFVVVAHALLVIGGFPGQSCACWWHSGFGGTA